MASLNLFRFSDDTEPFAQGQEIFRAGDGGDAMYVIQTGEVEIRVGDALVEVIGPGGIFGEMALVDRHARSATATAKTDCRLARIDERRFKYLVQQTPHFALEVMRVMATRLRQMNAHT